MVSPHEKSSQFPSKETSKVERKELRQLLFDLDQAGPERCFFSKTPSETVCFNEKLLVYGDLGGPAGSRLVVDVTPGFWQMFLLWGEGLGAHHLFGHFTWRDGLPGS